MAESYIPELLPDIWFKPLQADKDAFEFSFAVKKQALGPHIEVNWPWDDTYQRQIHEARLAAKAFFEIWRATTRIGTVSWMVHPTHARFGEFYLLDDCRGHGTGTLILTHMLKLADCLNLPVRLEYLKWNPVGRLYRRHGFLRTHETDNHVFLERPPADA